MGPGRRGRRGPEVRNQIGQRVAEAVREYRALAAKAACDYAFHIIVADPSEAHASADLRDCFAAGYSSVKVIHTHIHIHDNDPILDCHSRSHSYMTIIITAIHIVAVTVAVSLPLTAALGLLAEDDSETRSTSRKSVESVMTAGTAAQEHMDVPEVERDGVEEEAEPVEVDLPENVLGKQIRSQLQLRTLKKQQVRKSKSE